MEEMYKFYNPLKIDDVVIVDYKSSNPKYHKYYVDIVKNIKQNNINHICRLNTFNFDFELINKIDSNLEFSAIQYNSGIYTTTTSKKLMNNGHQFDAIVYSIDEFKQLLQYRDNIDKNFLYISDYEDLIKMYKVLVEAIELQNKNNIKRCK